MAFLLIKIVSSLIKRPTSIKNIQQDIFFACANQIFQSFILPFKQSRQLELACYSVKFETDRFCYYSVPFPEKWAGKRDADLDTISGISGCIFVHTNRFMGINKTYDGAMEMACQTLKMSGYIKQAVIFIFPRSGEFYPTSCRDSLISAILNKDFK